MPYLAFLLALIIGFYTVLFGIETWKDQNHLGFAGILILALSEIGLSFYLLFWRG